MKKILVVVDMQNDFLTGCLGNQECEAVIPKVKELLAKPWDRVFFTRDTHTDDYLQTQEGRKLPVPHCIKDTRGWQIENSIMEMAQQHYNAADVEMINKPAFGSMELAARLKALSVDDELELHFCGVCTGICVISNVMLAKAALPETEVYVHADACACVTPNSHQTALAAMKTCQVNII